MSGRRRNARAGPRVARAASCAIALLLAIQGALAAAGPSALARTRADGVDAGSRVDLAGARLEQMRNGDLALDLATHGPWVPADVKPAATRALCVWLRNELAPQPGGRLCVVPDPGAKSGVRLRYTVLDHRGRRTGIRELSAVVERGPATVGARFSPLLLRLVPGRYRWYVRSRSLGIEDRLPDAGELKLRVALSTAPAVRRRCFAAAARDPQRPCQNPLLRLAVVPTPDDAVLTTNSPCVALRDEGRLKPCEFGVPAVDASASVALIGDSHAAQWRGALEQVLQRKRWNGISITTSGCPLSRVRTQLEPASRRQSCRRWNGQVPRWLARHPKIHTIFVSQHAGSLVMVPPGGDPVQTRAAGYRAAWRALPSSVRRIVVLRDTPLLGFQSACVRSARAHRRNAGNVCALARDKALAPDSAVVAARQTSGRRVRVIDLTPFFCSRRRCLPVIGGALVYKDRDHMTDVFSTSLGPYVERAINRL
jgi:hypothetical protein